MAKKKKKLSKKKCIKKKGANKEILQISILLVYLLTLPWLFVSFRRYEFVHNGLPFWQISFVLAPVAVGVFLVSKFAKKILCDRGKGAVIGLALIVALFAFMTTMTYVSHLNHIFDFNEPERYVVVIEDKNYEGGPKSFGYHEFGVTINGETEDITVPRLHAYQFHEGDLYVVEYHKGAFNEPYYIGVGAP